MNPFKADYQSIRSIFDRSEVLLAYLYGSRATGTFRADSDLDFAVLFKDSVLKSEYWYRCAGLARALSRTLRFPDVDIRELNGAPLSVSYEVVANSRCVYAETDDLRVGYEAGVVDRYLDFRPMLEEYDRSLIGRVKEGAYGLREQRLAEDVGRTLSEPGGAW